MKKTFFVLLMFLAFFSVKSNALPATLELYQDLIGVPGGYATVNNYTVFSSIGTLFTPERSGNGKYIHYAGLWNPYAVNIWAKAIIVAGSGPYINNQNPLWNATETCTNQAYKILMEQGYEKSNVRYLSADPNAYRFDIDGNTKPDDIFGTATSDNLKQAITEWASDADNLLIYMTGHGGDKTFRIREFEILESSKLKTWLDNLQQHMKGKIVLLYDACQSGSFLPILSGANRIIFTSTDPFQNSVFLNNGTISFSNLLWNRFYNGFSLYDSYVIASESLKLLAIKQTSQCDANGDAVSNDKSDMELAAKLKIGKEILIASDIPSIETISQEQVICGINSSSIYVEGVTTADSVKQVLAVITPPDYNQSDTIIELPVMELTKCEQNNRYEGIYNDFNKAGKYYISVFAINGKGMVSYPISTTVDRQLSLYDIISALQFLTGETNQTQSVNYYVKMEDVLRMFEIMQN